MSDFPDEMTEKELKRLRVAAMNMYDNVDGRIVIEAILDDLGLYDEPQSEQEYVLHIMAMRILKKYFGLYGPDPRHRSMLTGALIKAARTPIDMED